MLNELIFIKLSKVMKNEVKTRRRVYGIFLCFSKWFPAPRDLLFPAQQKQFMAPPPDCSDVNIRK